MSIAKHHQHHLNNLKAATLTHLSGKPIRTLDELRAILRSIRTDTRRVAFKYQMIDIVTSASPAEVEAARAVAKEYCDALISQVVWRVFIDNQKLAGDSRISAASTEAPDARAIAKIVVEKAISNSVNSEAELAHNLVSAIIQNAIDRLSASHAGARREMTEKTEDTQQTRAADDEEEDDIDDFPSALVFQQYKKTMLGDGEDGIRAACARVCLPSSRLKKVVEEDAPKKKGLFGGLFRKKANKA